MERCNGTLCHFGDWQDLSDFMAECEYDLNEKVDENHPDWMEAAYAVPADKCGIIIGKRGCAIREISRVSGAWVNLLENYVPSRYSDQRLFRVRGLPEQVELALQMMADKFKSSEEKYTPNVLEPSDWIERDIVELDCPTSPRPPEGVSSQGLHEMVESSMDIKREQSFPLTRILEVEVGTIPEVSWPSFKTCKSDKMSEDEELEQIWNFDDPQPPDAKQSEEIFREGMAENLPKIEVADHLDAEGRRGMKRRRIYAPDTDLKEECANESQLDVLSENQTQEQKRSTLNNNIANFPHICVVDAWHPNSVLATASGANYRCFQGACTEACRKVENNSSACSAVCRFEDNFDDLI